MQVYRKKHFIYILNVAIKRTVPCFTEADKNVNKNV